MSRLERILYFIVILAMFALVILFRFRLKEIRQQGESGLQKSAPHSQRLFSFEGESPAGEKNFVHFTAYSPNYYIILNTSAGCPHCLSMLQDLQTYHPGNTLPENVFIFLITSDDFPDPLPPNDSPIKVLKVSYDDWIQFGIETPSGRVANGKGDIIARWEGYSPEVPDTALQAIQQHMDANTQSTRIDSR